MARKKSSSNFNWGSALIGAATATATAAILIAKPKDPKFNLISIKLKNLKPNFPSLDAEMFLTVHVTNPNVVPITYSSTTMSIHYDGALLGAARVEAGAQSRNSCQTLRLPARLSGKELAQHAGRFVGDVGKREMVLDAEVEIEGIAKVLIWDRRFKVRVDSRIVVDPVLLDVVDQENKTALKLFGPFIFPTNPPVAIDAMRRESVNSGPLCYSENREVGLRRRAVEAENYATDQDRRRRENRPQKLHFVRCSVFVSDFVRHVSIIFFYVFRCQG